MSQQAFVSSSLHGAPPITAAPEGPVLLVEDDGDIRTVLCEYLEDSGYTVVAANDAECAGDLLRGGLAPSVVVTDINLGPGENGLALADRVHRAFPGASVVFITGRLDMLRDRGLLHAEYVVPKPFPLSTLLAVMGKLRSH